METTLALPPWPSECRCRGPAGPQHPCPVLPSPHLSHPGQGPGCDLASVPLSNPQPLVLTARQLAGRSDQRLDDAGRTHVLRITAPVGSREETDTTPMALGILDL